MTNPFEVTPKRIEDLSEGEFVALVNRLIWDDARRLGLAPNDVRISMRIDDPDQGADAITNGRHRGGRSIENGLGVWQFKKSWRDLGRLRKEVEKGKAVQDIFRQGGGYTLVVGRRMVPNTQLSREAGLRAMVSAAGCSGNVRLFAAEQVAAWASSVPAAAFDSILTSKSTDASTISSNSIPGTKPLTSPTRCALRLYRPYRRACLDQILLLFTRESKANLAWARRGWRLN